MATNNKDNDRTKHAELAVEKLQEVWGFLEVMEITPSESQFHRATVQVMGILKEVREILGE